MTAAIVENEMDQLEERICEEVRKYPHLYDFRSPHHKDSAYSSSSWREIATNVGLDTAETVRKWKNARDKFVRQRRDMRAKKSGKRVPAFYISMSWLEPFVKHRQTTLNIPSETQTTQDTDPSCDLSTDASSDPPSPARTLESLYVSQPSTSSAVRVSSTCARPAANCSTSPAPCKREPASQTKRKRTDDQDIHAHLEQLSESRLMLQRSLQQDDCSSFGMFMADMLRKVPVDSRDIVTRNAINHMYDQVEREQTSLPVSVDINGSLAVLSVNTRAPTESPKTSPEPSHLSSPATTTSQLPTTSLSEISPKKEQTSLPVSVDINGSLAVLSVNNRAPTESPKTSPEPSHLSSPATTTSQLPTTSLSEISPIASSNSSTGSQVESLPSPSTPAAPMTAPSPLSRGGQKKKRQREIDDSFAKTMERLEERLEERKLAIEKRLQDTGDEYSRFGQTVADLLRKVPLEKRDSLMYKVYGMIYAQRQ
ncbi:uncharacterized protein PAE49_009053 [Odontesthes bonariensis]|uniref:uncharacterized protein LOC142385809 n=1 Tax=Odontesthes bonariensis TaxID=219752 RepID=UPI003F584B4E